MNAARALTVVVIAIHTGLLIWTFPDYIVGNHLGHQPADRTEKTYVAKNVLVGSYGMALGKRKPREAALWVEPAGSSCAGGTPFTSG